MDAARNVHSVLQGTLKGKFGIDVERWCLKLYGHKDGDFFGGILLLYFSLEAIGRSLEQCLAVGQFC